MSENIKIKSTTMGGGSHAFEFHGQLKWLAIAATVVIVSSITAITMITLRAIDRCAAPCFIEASHGRLVLAPAGELVAQEIRLIGTIPAPHRNPLAPLPAVNVATAPVAALDAPRPSKTDTVPKAALATPANTQRTHAAKPARVATVNLPANRTRPPGSAGNGRQPKPAATLPALNAHSDRMHLTLWRTIDRS